MIVRVLISAGQNGASSCTGAMMADIADYEVARTGNFLPGTVAACYSFVDKLISSFSTTIAGFSLAMIGYTTTMPQPGDPATTALRVLTIVMTLGMPIIGWVCTIIAMKFYPLTTEKMVEVQTQVHEMREAAQTEQPPQYRKSGEASASPLLIKGLPLLVFAAVFCRGGAGELPKGLAEIAAGAEVQPVGNLLYARVGDGEQQLCPLNLGDIDVIVDGDPGFLLELAGEVIFRIPRPGGQVGYAEVLLNVQLDIIAAGLYLF